MWASCCSGCTASPASAGNIGGWDSEAAQDGRLGRHEVVQNLLPGARRFRRRTGLRESRKLRDDLPGEIALQILERQPAQHPVLAVKRSESDLQRLRRELQRQHAENELERFIGSAFQHLVEKPGLVGALVSAIEQSPSLANRMW